MGSFSSGTVYQFAGFTLDLDKSALLSAGGQRMLRPKAQALLTHLARNMGRVVPKSELLDAVWPDVYVTEDSLTQSIREIRKALGDEHQKLIRTVSKRGYLLAADAEPAAKSAPMPVLAVFRFRNDTGESLLTPTIDGFAEEIISGLARFRSVVLLALQPSFSHAPGDPGSTTTERERAGIDYAVEGFVRRIGSGLRLSVSLVDAKTSTQHWGESYDLGTGTFYDVGAEIIERVIGRLAARLEVAGIARVARKRPEDLEAHELMLKGVAIARWNQSKEFASAAGYLEAAVARDPTDGLALAHLAFVKVMQRGFGRSSADGLAEALELAARAITLAPDQPTAHRALSFVQAYRREFAAAEHHIRKAHDLNPYDADILDQMGYLLTLRGRPVEGLSFIARAIELNPMHPPWYHDDRSFALYLLGEYRAAADAIEVAPIPPAWMQAWLGACYARMGDMNKARACIARMTELDPNFSAENFARCNGAAFEHAADHQHFAEGVMMALGLPPESWSEGRDVMLLSAG